MTVAKGPDPKSSGPTKSDMTDTNTRLAEVTKALESLEKKIEAENILRARRIGKAERAIRLTIGFAILAVIVAILGVGVGVRGIQVGNEAKVALRVSESATLEARVNACLQANGQQYVQIRAEQVESHDLIATLVRASGNTAEAQKVAKAFNAKHDKLIVGAHADRDCTPAGIAAFLSPPPTTVPRIP